MKRNFGLDVLRVFALFLMVSIHYARYVPSTSPVADALKFIGEAAPAVFFFAFGMTFHKFAEKDTAYKLTSSVLFLYVAMFHNLYTKFQIVATDFLFFLFLWRLIISVGGKDSKSLRAVYCAMIVGVVSWMALAELGYVDGLFNMIIPGPFPLLPWGIFVVAGVLYAEISKPRADLWAGMSIIALSLILAGVGYGYNISGLTLNKWPISASYVILFIGASIFVVGLSNRINIDGLRRNTIILFISSNLLLCTVLHYLTTNMMTLVHKKVHSNLPLSGLTWIIVGSIISFGLTIALVFLVKRSWDYFCSTDAYLRVRQYNNLIAIVLLIGLSLTLSPFHDLMEIQQNKIVFNICKLVAISCMAYFTLEMGQIKKTRLNTGFGLSGT